MQNKLTGYLKMAMEVVGFGLAIIGFSLNDYNKIKNLTMIQYITEHWNWFAIAFLFAIFIRLFRLTIREDIKDIHSDMIKSTQDLQKIFIPALAMNNIFIREILIKSIPEDKLYELLDEAVFKNRQLDIPDLENFGIDQKHINKLKTKYHEIEIKKVQ